MERMKIKASFLPVIDLAGTDFYVDVHEREFRQADAPDNRIAMAKIIDDDTQISSFAFDRRTKNVYAELLLPGCIPDYVTLVIVPPLTEITEKFNQQIKLANQSKQQMERRKTRHGRHKTIH